MAAIEKSIKVGLLLLGCKIAPILASGTVKITFYPDMPKNYQISQFDQPICEGEEKWKLKCPEILQLSWDPIRIVQLTRIHLEEDVGKLTSLRVMTVWSITTEPVAPLLGDCQRTRFIFSRRSFCLFNFAPKFSRISQKFQHCDMEKGQLRCDANISVRPVGTEALGTKVEIKNLKHYFRSSQWCGI